MAESDQVVGDPLSDCHSLKGSLSDFNSCIESMDSSGSSSDDEDNLKINTLAEPTTMNEKKRLKSIKRRLALTPGKEDFIKKQNTKLSPK